MTTSERTAFKRMNFFDGFFTTAEDWQADQRYHLDKRRLHNRYLHTPGIIFGEGDGLKITPVIDPKGTHLQVQVCTGAAIDGQGDLVYLTEPTICDVAPLPAPASQLIYIGLHFAEVEAELQENAEDPDYRGFTRIVEQAIVEASTQKPDGSHTLELARIDLRSGATAIVDPTSDVSPGPNEIDTRHAPRAGAVDPRFGALLERLQKLHEYHLAKQRRHNRGLYKPGLLHGVLEELAVLPAGGLVVEVRPGAALDGAGNELYLDQSVRLSIPPPTTPRRAYVVAGYEDHFGAYLADPTLRFGNSYRTAKISLADTVPDPEAWIELARIDLDVGATEVRLPADPGRPQHNEIDRRSVSWALSIAVVEPLLPPELRDRIIELMRLKRGAFTTLGARFPVPSATDVRHAAVNLEALARNESIRPERLAEVWGLFTTLEQDVGQEIGAAYPPVVDKPEYKHYQDAVAALGAALYARENEQILLNRQSDVVTAASDLAEVVFEAPEADAGPDQTIPTLTGQADAELDASGSHAHDDQKIVGYHWDKEE
jgi:hypothetical protein